MRVIKLSKILMYRFASLTFHFHFHITIMLCSIANGSDCSHDNTNNNSHCTYFLTFYDLYLYDKIHRKLNFGKTLTFLSKIFNTRTNSDLTLSETGNVNWEIIFLVRTCVPVCVRVVSILPMHTPYRSIRHGSQVESNGLRV